MKFTITLCVLILSFKAQAFAKIETKTKPISNVIVETTECRGPYLHDYWAPVVIPSGGEVSVTSSTTTVVAKASYEEVKCVTEETYSVKITGIDWLGTKKITEIPGTRKRSSRLVNVSKDQQLAHTIFEYKFDNLKAEFDRVRSVLNTKIQVACLKENQTSQSRAVGINETECATLEK